ncbi:MAG: S9 family peptidase [Firmicutes bacterium]|nr:S9 family peptidase [Bacillota bacterium]
MARRLTLDDVARLPAPGMAVPVRIGFTPDSRAVTYLFPQDGSERLSLWFVDIATGERRHVSPDADRATLTLEEELRRERERLAWEGVTSYAFAPRAEPAALLVPLGDRVFVRFGDGPFTEVPEARGAVDPQLFPDGTRLAFVREGELHVLDLGSRRLARLTSGAADGLYHGLAEFVAQEELGRSHGYWIRPDGRLIAFTQVDERHVPLFPIVHQGDEPLFVEPHRYPFAGEENAKVRLGVVPAEGGDVLWLKTDEDAYLARVAWMPSGELAVLLLSRDQRAMEWRRYDPATGAYRVFHRETAEHWLNLGPDPHFLETGEVLLTSERSGYQHLYLLSPDGGLRPLTSGEWMVTALADVDEARRLAYFLATAESPLERHLYAVPLDGGPVRRLTEEPGWHTAVFSPDHAWFVQQVSSLEYAPRTRLRRADGALVRVLHEDPQATAEALGLQPPRIVELQAEDGTRLYGAVYRPADGGAGGAGSAAGEAAGGDGGADGAARGGRRPAIVSVYGGPHAQRVTRQWELTVDLRAQYLAQQGFIVFRLDNRGSAHRGVAFERALHRRFGTVELADQIAGVRWLVENEGADADRIGIYGWSYGGYMTLMALAKAGDVFKAGAAGAPVVDFRWYDTAYTERYMDTPQANPEGYREASVLTHLGGLRGHLLILHGLIDENVHFRHTARLVRALIEAGKPFEFALLPASRHMPRGFPTRRYIEERVTSFFLERL